MILHTKKSQSLVNRFLKNEGGTVTLFAFGANQSLSKHSTPFDALFQCVEGCFTVTIENETHLIDKDELILLPANIPHSVVAEDASKCLLTMIKAIN
ncbi:MAG: cupin domain-containing protein [Bacteroidota bacterium]|nr:cupin domain-containing protein [Bacteroidota bacterium]